MTDAKQSIAMGRLAGLGLLTGLATALLLFCISGAIAYTNTTTLRHHSSLIAHTHDVLTALNEVYASATNAETAQRAYLITGDERYLTPYAIATGRMTDQLDSVQQLTADNPTHRVNIPRLRARWEAKLETLEAAVTARRGGGVEAAAAVINSDRGRMAMSAIREQIEEMKQAEQEIRRGRLAEISAAYTTAVRSGVLSALLGVALSAMAAYLLRLNLRSRRRQEWLQAGQLRLSELMAGEQKLEPLTDNVLRFMVDYLGARAGAFFIADGDLLLRTATVGVPASGAVPERVEPGDGLLSQAAKRNRVVTLGDVPDGYLAFGSAFGQGKPRHLAIVPAAVDGRANAVFELGFADPVAAHVLELFSRVSEPIGLAIRSVNYRAHLQGLLGETQRQAEELQTQAEELRVTNEELEEQGRTLRESQTQLEGQQAELEATNTQLEEQSQLLEARRDEVEQANATLKFKTQELERASQYKSDFLANMSHELRTPLNSALILSKLLADNPAGNLSEEQVQYASTIHAAGNDLLTLINDILDLAKIEAGRMEVQSDPIELREVVAALERVFQPVAEHKGLTLKVELQPGTPKLIETDRQRLDQVLKNLLSNAIKFTPQGEVTLAVVPEGESRIGFAVADTGIGIAADQQELVFEAFRQADGTTNRKFGGTGLGLSISRELARLLGGDIRLGSEPGRGSVFTLSLPAVYDPGQVLPRRPHAMPDQQAERVADPPRQTASALRQAEPQLPGESMLPPPRRMAGPSRRVPDDRERLAAGRRVLLIVEDDEPFARILLDLAHELGYQCLVASTAEDACAMAAQYQPSAVVLDVGLPDHSGLWVLDRLKTDRRTRHVPVHVISAGDYAQTALSLGAVGYMLKPVKRGELADALRQLETRLEQRMHKVLVVEDDPVQRESLRALLGSQDVQTVGAGTAAECLELLRESTFDCMVLDLSLPDASGYSLLERLSREDAYSFPPVIVYTGRELTADEEHRLRRFSKSIIIKGARSPERLLDEVTLFLHKVVADLPPEQQQMLEKSRSRDTAIEGRRILVVEDDVRNVFALTSVLEPRGASVSIARNGREALELLERPGVEAGPPVDLVLMDVMMPEMDGLTAVREIRKRPALKKLPVIMLTAKAMKDDQEQCLRAGANDYMAKPLDVEKLLSLVRVWMPR